MSIFYKPDDSFAADFNPFYWRGKYHLFYLRDWRNREKYGEGTPWWHLVTEDFVHFEDHGEILARGTKDEQDLYVFTGSVLAAKDAFHIYYTGCNPHWRPLPEGRPEQGIMHAVSPDLYSWTKDHGFLFNAPVEQGYERHDWRDPFVYWDKRYKEYGMLIAGRKSSGPSRNRGCTALATSSDLINWIVRDPLWEPDEYHTHECPDLFRIGKWWYLLFSTFSERMVTHYRMSRSLQGPWLAPPDDVFDARAFYAAKTASNGKSRFLFGWLPTQEGEKDDGNWQWGGNLVVHQIVQQKDGTLTVQMPRTVRSAFENQQPMNPIPVLGKWQIKGRSFSSQSISRLSLLSVAALPSECLIEFDLTFDRGTLACGILLRADSDFGKYYMVRIEPANQRLVIDRWPRPGYQPFMLERPLQMKSGVKIHFQMILSDTCLVVYADNCVALSCRMYDHRQGNLGLMITEGNASFKKVIIRGR